jgi:hypothetical protein
MQDARCKLREILPSVVCCKLQGASKEIKYKYRLLRSFHSLVIAKNEISNKFGDE